MADRAATAATARRAYRAIRSRASTHQPAIFAETPLLPLGDSLGIDAVACGQRPQALLTILYCSTDRLCRCSAAVKNLSHSASFHCLENNAPSNSGTKHLVHSGPRTVSELVGRLCGGSGVSWRIAGIRHHGSRVGRPANSGQALARRLQLGRPAVQTATWGTNSSGSSSVPQHRVATSGSAPGDPNSELPQDLQK